LPEDRASERQEVFYEALAGFEASTGQYHNRFEDMATLVIRFWDELPPALVLEATDRILDRAKEETDANSPLPINVSSHKGTASFRSIYELRLFQLLPVIHTLDEPKAEQLLRENQQTKAMLERYPGGMQSLDTGMTGTPNGKEEHSDIVTIASGPVPEFDLQVERREAEIEKQTKAIYELALRDPKRALESALALPGLPEARAQTLITVGNLVGERNSSIAKSAVKEALKLSAEFEPLFRVQILKDAADVYLQLRDQDAALKTIAEGSVFAQQLYAKDADLTAPNTAPKAQCPSTNASRQFVGLSARVSPEEATKVIDEVPDPEIHAFLRVALASLFDGRRATNGASGNP
jgi:hypothetical protein